MTGMPDPYVCGTVWVGANGQVGASVPEGDRAECLGPDAVSGPRSVFSAGAGCCSRRPNEKQPEEWGEGSGGEAA